MSSTTTIRKTVLAAGALGALALGGSAIADAASTSSSSGPAPVGVHDPPGPAERPPS